MIRPALAALAAASIILSFPVLANDTASPYGLWRNPKNTVIVRIAPCSAKLCGTVAWAAPSAEAVIQKKSGRRLVGTTLLSDYNPAANGQWRGKVFVPDIGRKFSSAIAQVDANTLDISGCLFGTVLCKHQRWQRVSGEAARL